MYSYCRMASEPPLSDALAAILVAPFAFKVDPSAGLRMATTGGVTSAVAAGGGGVLGAVDVVLFATLTETDAELPALPATSYATAERAATLLAIVVESQVNAKGGVVSVATVVPLTRSSTFVTPTLSLADVLTVTKPLTLVPPNGLVIETVGA